MFFIAVFGNAQSGGEQVIEYLAEQGMPTTGNNKLKLLKSGKEKFDDLFREIAGAKHHVHLEYFNFRNDSIAGLLFDLLAIKAKQGVKVRAVFDDFGNCSNNKPLKNKDLKQLRKRGIEIEIFDPIHFPFLNHIAHRDHRKIVIIDGKIGYTGGINIADYYITGLPQVGEWRDMHLRIEGEAVNYLQKIFLETWRLVTKQEIAGDGYFNGAKDTVGELSDTARKISIAIVDRIPRKLPKQLRHAYLKSISVSKTKIQIVNPYFLPPSSIRKELRKAIERGVTVEIMISAKSDIAFTPDGTFHVAHQLMKKGADVYVYNTGFHHSKTMTVDDTFSTVGSANLDSRSLCQDYEVNAFIFDKEITDELNRIFENDKANSTKMTPEEWTKRSKWRRFVGWVANTIYTLL
ncbi:MAG: cardiolipin synthase [Prevotellaceae bacterium]|jgi:cardiolipin synthase|nr:cardiolipin synthase [Prevotellaceae bacterium]